MKYKRTIVTGATGILGVALVKRLLYLGGEVYAICRPGTVRKKYLPDSDRVHVIDCNILELNKLQDYIDMPCDIFFHLAWLGNSERSNVMDLRLQMKNIECAIDAVDVAQWLGCKVFIGAGSQSEYGSLQGILHPYSATNPVSGYGIAKYTAGKLTRLECHKYGIRHIWPRIMGVYGSHDIETRFLPTVIATLLSGKKPLLTMGEQIWDYVYADDAADALCKIAERGKGDAIYLLGSGHARALREYIEIIRDSIDHGLLLGFGELPYKKDQNMHIEADISSLCEDTGWQPRYDFTVGIKKVLDEIGMGE